jgi:Methyltransferase domain
MQAVLGSDLDESVELGGARLLLLAVSDCQASFLFDEAEQYRCESAESATADLIAEPAELVGLPDACFDAVVAGSLSATGADLERALGEMRRVLVPDGLFLAPASFASTARLACFFDVRTVPGFDPSTGMSDAVHVGRKDTPPLDSQPPVAAELSGYAFHFSRKSRRRIVFCLGGPVATGDQLPIQSAEGAVVGQVTVGRDAGGHAAPDEPWREGFRLPPRATYDLDPSLPSGVYSLDGKIPFVHRRESAASIAVLLPSHTATAFNPAGGRRFYGTGSEPPADVLSFQRPLMPGLLLVHCRPFVKWFASGNPYAEDTTYLIDSDLEEPDGLEGVEVLIVIGRSEYWTRAMREHFDSFVDRGGRALLLCSEVMYWQVRVDLKRQRIFRYRHSDPHPDPLLRTVEWRDPSLRYPVYPRTGCERWHGGVAADDEGIGCRGMRIVCPDSPLLAETGLAKGDLVPLPDAVNWDGAPIESWLDGLPRVDFGDSPPWRHEVVGYARAKSTEDRSRSATGLWMVLRRKPDAGTVIHGGTMGWCGPWATRPESPYSDLTRSLILRMLGVLVDDDWPFSGSSDETERARGPSSTGSLPTSR